MLTDGNLPRQEKTLRFEPKRTFVAKMRSAHSGTATHRATRAAATPSFEYDCVHVQPHLPARGLAATRELRARFYLGQGWALV